jgi:glycosyltransferase involved in cell wall biosynthesis
MVHLRNIGGVSGGLEKVLAEFSAEMARRGHEVTVIVYDKTGKKPYYPFHPQVRYVNLYELSHEPDRVPILHKVSREWYRMRGQMQTWIEGYRRPYIVPPLTKIIHEIGPDIIINYHYSCAGFIAEAAPHCPVATMLHNEPKELLAGISERERQAIAQSAVIQVLVPGYKKTVLGMFPHTPCCCIPNCIPQYAEAADLSRRKEQYHIIHVGRISRVAKRQHLLIEAFHMLAEELPEWDVSFWGNGSKKYLTEMKELVKRYHLEDRVFFRGVTHHMKDEYIRSDLFVFPSAFEGFGLAMGEAMSSGLPVVAYKSCPAVNEIVRDGIDGYLVEDGIRPLAEAMKKLMLNPDLRVQMGRAARENMKNYSPEKVWDAWESLLHSVLAGRPLMEDNSSH